MKRISGASLAFVLVVASDFAIAADLPVKAPIVKAPIAPPAYSWTGFYLGANFGYSVGRDRTSLEFSGSTLADQVTIAPRGALGGLQAGFNWQAGQWVLGVEVDGQWTGQKDSYCFNGVTCPPGTRGLGQELPWFATTRLRGGYAAGPALLYVTGGAAFADVKQILDCCGLAPVEVNNSRTGFAVGGGIEAAVAGNWTAKIEYLYLDLGSLSNSVFFPPPAGGLTLTAPSTVRDHIGRLGLNYRFASPAAPPAALAAHNWTGFHLGANAGYGFGGNAAIQTFASGFLDGLTIAPGGAVAGGQIGYDWQAANWVFGVEADAQWSGQKDQLCRFCVPTPGFNVQFLEQEIAWFATVRGRVGYTVGPALFYATGGAAVANVKTSVTNIVTAGTASGASSSDKSGWTIGAGIETALAGNWSAKFEYLYMDLGTVTVSAPAPSPSSITSHVHDHVARVGVNYKFESPAFAKY